MSAFSNFWQRVITGILFLIVVVGSIVFSFQSFIILFGLVVLLATHEYIKIVSKFSSPNKWMLYICNLTIYSLVSLFLLMKLNSGFLPSNSHHFQNFLSDRLFTFLFLLIPVIMIIAELFRKKEKPFENLVYTILGLIYIAVPFILLVLAFAPVIGDYNYQIVLSYFLLLWIADTFSYVWGKLLGKHKLVPRISEGKTIEGTIGGIITTIGISILGPHVFPSVGYSLTEWVVFAALISVLAVPSDLSESLLKRQAGVKDSGKILPGHGGILDRFDSVLLTAPVVYIYTQIVMHI